MKNLVRILNLTFILLLAPKADAQITIERCHTAAERNYPLARRYELVQRSLQYTLENAARSWWPGLQLSAKAQIQSDVTQLPLDPSRLAPLGIDLPTLPKDQYQVNISLAQPLYDGGAVRAGKKVARARAEVDAGEVRTGLYALRGRVNQLYFGILLTQEQLRINAAHQDNLRANLRRVSSLIRGGLAHEADLDALRVELVKAEQTAAGYRSTRSAYLSMLALLAGIDIPAGTTFRLPAESEAPAGTPLLPALGEQRPEVALYDARIRHIDARQAQIRADLRPRLSLFLQGGYGRPVLNMLDDRFSAYGIAGLNLSWNISSLYTYKRRSALLQNQAEDMRIAREAFLYNTRIDATEHCAEVALYDSLLTRDKEVIRLSARISRSAEAKVAGGTASTTDLVIQLGNEQQARLGEALHRLQRLLAIYQYRTIVNQ